MLYNDARKQLSMLLRRFFENCTQRNHVILLPKSKLFAKTIKLCGRRIDGKGHRYDPANYEAMKIKVKPTNGAELCQFINAATRMGNAIIELPK